MAVLRVVNRQLLENSIRDAIDYLSTHIIVAPLPKRCINKSDLLAVGGLRVKS